MRHFEKYWGCSNVNSWCDHRETPGMLMKEHVGRKKGQSGGRKLISVIPQYRILYKCLKKNKIRKNKKLVKSVWK